MRQTSKVKLTITIECKRPDGVLTETERWDIIASAAIAVRAAIQQYVKPEERERACRAVASVLREPVPTSTTFSERMETYECPKCD
jgi:hypothetical protein